MNKWNLGSWWVIKANTIALFILLFHLIRLNQLSSSDEVKTDLKSKSLLLYRRPEGGSQAHKHTDTHTMHNLLCNELQSESKEWYFSHIELRKKSRIYVVNFPLNIGPEVISFLIHQIFTNTPQTSWFSRCDVYSCYKEWLFMPVIYFTCNCLYENTDKKNVFLCTEGIWSNDLNCLHYLKNGPVKSLLIRWALDAEEGGGEDNGKA